MSDAPVLDPRERFHDYEEAIRAALEGFQTQLWTAMPCVVAAVRLNGENFLTADLQPVVRGQRVDQFGKQTFFKRAMILNCPIAFPQGGGFTLTFPVAVGDEVLAVFSCRNTRAWWLSGGVDNVEPVLRMHSLSDGFCIPGVRSLARPLSGVSANSVQLRNDAGDTYVEVAGGQVVNVKGPGGITLDAGAGDITLKAMNLVGQIDNQVNMTVTVSVNLITPATLIAGTLSAGTGGGSVAAGGNATFGGNITTSKQVTSTLGGTHTLTLHVHSDPQGGSVGPPTG